MAVCAVGVGLVGVLLLSQRNEVTSGESTELSAVTQVESASEPSATLAADNAETPPSPSLNDSEVETSETPSETALTAESEPGETLVDQETESTAEELEHEVTLAEESRFIEANAENLDSISVAVEDAFNLVAAFVTPPSVTTDAGDEFALGEQEELQSQTDAAHVIPTASSPEGTKYSSQAPDPSEALSEALGNEQAISDEVIPELEPTDIVMPEPELDQPELDDQSELELEADPSNAPAIETPETPTVEPPAARADENTDAADDLKPQASSPVPSSKEADELKPSDSQEETDSDNVIAGELTTEETSGAEIAIQNPSMNQLPVWFVINQRKIRLEPGQKFVCSGAKSFDVRFSRGGDFGVAKSTVSRGTWRFSVSRQDGWQLKELNW